MSKIAVITTGGKQYLVKEGDTIRVEKLDLVAGAVLNFAPLMTASVDGAEFSLGAPELSDRKIEAKVLVNGRAKKINVIKFKAKVRFKRKAGHRQPYSELSIGAIK